MIEDRIAEVGIDGELKLFVRPARTSFARIHRAKRKIRWNEARRRLLGPAPAEWSYVEGFGEILAAAADEYRVRLRLTPATIWSNISDELKSLLQAPRREAPSPER
jgi:hypothetical protein